MIGPKRVGFNRLVSIHIKQLNERIAGMRLHVKSNIYNLVLFSGVAGLGLGKNTSARAEDKFIPLSKKNLFPVAKKLKLQKSFAIFVTKHFG